MCETQSFDFPRRLARRSLVLSILSVVFLVCKMLPACVYAEDAAIKQADTQALTDSVSAGSIGAADFSTAVLDMVEKKFDFSPALIDFLLENQSVADVLREMLVERVKRLALNGSSLDLLVFKKFAEKHFGARDEATKRISRYVFMLERFEYVQATKDLVVVAKLRERIEREEENHLFLDKLIKWLHLIAKDSLEQGRPEVAIAQLAEVSANRRTDNTVSLASESFEKLWKFSQNDSSLLAIMEVWPFDAKNVQSLVEELARREPNVVEKLAALYSRRVLYLVKSQDIFSATAYFKEVLRLRPDDNRENDELRLDIAFVASDNKSRAFAEARIAELESRSRLSFFSKIRLFFDGYYFGWFFVLLFTVCGLVLVVVVAYFVLRAVRYIQSKMPEKVVLGRIEREDEYSRLLALFGLDDTATEEDIKHAYRDMVKAYHPDMQHNPGNVKKEEFYSARFLELREAYEQLLIMKKGMFFKKK